MKVKNAIRSFFERPWLPYFVLPLVIYFATEVMNRRSLLATFEFIFTRPHVFIANLAIVTFTFSIAIFTKRRLFWYTLNFCIWLLLAIVNFVLLFMRNSPFNASDLAIFKYGILITDRYMSVPEMILSVAAILLVIGLCVVLFKFGFKYEGKLDRVRSAIVAGSVLMVGAIAITVCLLTNQMSYRFENLSDGYNKNGFPFSFACSAFVQGVDEPENFSAGSVEAICSPIKAELKDPEVKPNVIVLQLESFFDPRNIKDVDFEENPIPVFSSLRDEGISGKLSVPVVGGGTSNTEFEVLTGMSLDFFGTVEYPYETFLKSKTCESAAYNFSAMGYRTAAIHNFSAEFYGRNKIYANLGFDRFTPLEYMCNTEFNEIGWTKDAVLERYIMDSMTNTKERDLVFTVSVQGHGMYPDDFDDHSINYSPDDEELDISDMMSKIEFFTKQVNEMDGFLGSLVASLAEFEEPTVLVAYGDHLPGINFTPEMLECDMYQTEYVIWSNYPLEGEERDLETWQLMAYVQELLSMNSGVLTRFHHHYADDESYIEYLQTLEYDMVEGDMVSLDGKEYEAADITLGTNDIVVTNVKIIGDKLYISGENFTEYSTVYINGSRHNCEYVNDHTLTLPERKLKDGDIFEIGIINYHNFFSVLSKGPEFVYSTEN